MLSEGFSQRIEDDESGENWKCCCCCCLEEESSSHLKDLKYISTTWRQHSFWSFNNRTNIRGSGNMPYKEAAERGCFCRLFKICLQMGKILSLNKFQACPAIALYGWFSSQILAPYFTREDILRELKKAHSYCLFLLICFLLHFYWKILHLSNS